MLWLEGVGCRASGGDVLDGVTLGVASGEIVVIEGAPASGKSTLLEIAAATRTPDRGGVWFAGRNTATLQRASMPFVRRNIGFCSPDSRLIGEDSARENVMAALAVRGESRRAAEDLAGQALALVRAENLADRLVVTLSSVQKHLVALARALAGPPPLVVADEPSGLLGDELRAVVVSALAHMRDRGAAVLVASADRAFAELLVEVGGRRINLAEGRIVGAPAMGLVPVFTPAPVEPGEEKKSPARVITLEVDDGLEGDQDYLPPASKGPA